MDSTSTLGLDPISDDIAIEPKFREQGFELLQQGRFTEAAALLQKAVNSDSSDEVAWRLLGGALASAGNHAEAVPAFERAVFLAPTNARNFYNLGVALQGVGRDSEARSALETSIRIDPTYQQARTRMESLNRASQNSPVGAPISPIGSSPIGSSPIGSSPIGSSPIGSSPIGSSPIGSSPIGSSPVGSSPIAMNELGSIGFSPGNPISSPQAADAPTARPAPAPTAHLGGMAGLSSLGSIGGSPIEAVPAPPSTPSSAAPLLRQPAPAAQVTGAYTPQSAYGTSASSFAPNPVLGLGPGLSQNSSGMQGDVPAEIAGGFNFGAAIISFWWLRNHNLRPISLALAGVYFVIRMVNSFAHSSFTPIFILVVQTGAFFALGFLGNKIAWQNRRFDDIEDFKACQRIWMYWAIPVACLQVGLLVFVFMMASIAGATAAGTSAGGVTPLR